VFRCRYCSSRKAAYDLLPHYEVRGHIVHRSACRVRWDMIARQVVDLDFLEFLDRRDVHTAQYGQEPPRHRFLDLYVV